MTSTDKLLPQLTKPQTENSDVGYEPEADAFQVLMRRNAANDCFEPIE